MILQLKNKKRITFKNVQRSIGEIRRRLRKRDAASEWDILLHRRSGYSAYSCCKSTARKRGEEVRNLQLSTGQENHGETSKLLLRGSNRPLQSLRTGSQKGSRSPSCTERHILGIPLVPPFWKICGWTRRKFSLKTPWNSGWRIEATTSFFCRGGEAMESRRAGSQVKKKERLQV